MRRIPIIAVIAVASGAASAQTVWDEFKALSWAGKIEIARKIGHRYRYDCSSMKDQGLCYHTTTFRTSAVIITLLASDHIHGIGRVRVWCLNPTETPSSRLCFDQDNSRLAFRQALVGGVWRTVEK